MSDEVRPSPAVTAWRRGLVVAGVLLLGIGAYYFLSGVSPRQYPGVLLWLGGALVLHDGIGAMAVFGVTVLARRTGRILPFAVLAIVQGALAVAAIVTLLVVPEIVKRALGTANPTILPLDYLRNLLLFYAALAVVTGAGVIAAFAVRASRRRARPNC